MDNGDFLISLGGTELDCMKSCAASLGCLTYAYAPYGAPSTPNQPTCYLKSTIDPKTFKIQTYDVSAGLVKPCGRARIKKITGRGHTETTVAGNVFRTWQMAIRTWGDLTAYVEMLAG
ncbi:hypothetical protein B0H19DRAFT_1066059 [Mycena capillaripes]|nr:hypothetical protein B0H19DRAFT_1066059 [Mycena capillaripes]